MEYQIFGPEEEYKGTMIISDTYVVEFSKSGNSYIIDGSGNVRRDETGDKVASRDGVLIKPASTSINIGSELTLNILANTNDYKVTCSDESVLQVKKDLSGNIKVTNNTITVKGLKLGKATIVVETSKEKRAISYITVHQEPTSIELSATSEILDISSVIKSLQIKPTIYPSTANYKTGITWTSSNNDVAVVDSNGFVTGISNGEVTITATTENGRAATWKVVVISTPLEISLDSENLVLDINGVNTHQYATTIYPSTANASIGLRWEIESSSSPNVISISSNGVVTGLSNGTATVRVTTENNKTATGFVTVQTSPIGIQLNKNNVTLDLTANPKSIQLTSTILPSTANVQNVVKWSSSNSSIASVGNDGTVIGVSNGTAVITATTQNGKTTKCNVKVQTSPVSLSLNKAKTTLNMTGTKTTKLYPVYDPKTSNVNTKLTWKSSDTSVATVDQDGNVTAKKNGTTVITDIIPDGTTLVDGTITENGKFDKENKTITWNNVVVPANSEVSVNFDVVVNAKTIAGEDVKSVKNTATIGNTPTEEVETKVANITTVKTSEGIHADGTPVTEENPLHELDRITYTLTATNNGNGKGTVKISDTVPEGTTLVADSIKIGNDTYTEKELNEGIDVTLEAGEKKSITFIVTINPFKDEKIVVRNADAKQDEKEVPPTDDEVIKEYVSIDVNKEFVDKENVDELRPTEIVVALYKNAGDATHIDTRTLNEQNNWKASFTNHEASVLPQC